MRSGCRRACRLRGCRSRRVRSSESAQLAADAAGAFGPVTVLVNQRRHLPTRRHARNRRGNLRPGLRRQTSRRRSFSPLLWCPGWSKPAAVLSSSTSAPGSRASESPQALSTARPKGALETLTRTWAAEFGAQGIRVNAISPGVNLRRRRRCPRCRLAHDGHDASGQAGCPGRHRSRRRLSRHRRSSIRPRRRPRHRRGRSNVFTTAPLTTEEPHLPRSQNPSRRRLRQRRKLEFRRAAQLPAVEQARDQVLAMHRL